VLLLALKSDRPCPGHGQRQEPVRRDLFRQPDVEPGLLRPAAQRHGHPGLSVL